MSNKEKYEKLKQEICASLEELFINQGWTKAKIADHYGVSISYIKTLLRDMGLGRPNGHRLTALFKIPTEELYDLYIVQNKTQEEMACLYNVKAGVVKNELIHRGIEKEIIRADFSNVSNEDFLKIYNDPSLSIQEVADKFGSTIQGIYQEAYRRGLRTTEGVGQKRAVQTTLSRYGVEYAAQVEEVRTRTCQTNLVKYGVTNPMLSSEIQARQKQTCLERYGVPNSMQVPEVQEKVKKTCMERYGVECVLQNSDVQEKGRQTCLERYGYSYPMSHPGIRKKWIESAKASYGKEENPEGCARRIAKMKRTLYEKYGGNEAEAKYEVNRLATLSRKGKEYKYDELNDKEKFIALLDSFEEPKTLYEISKEYGLATSTLDNKLLKWGLIKHPNICLRPTTSQPEKDIVEWLKEWGVNYETHNRKIIYPYEIDIYLPDKKMGIEFNGNYWHSATQKDSAYHQRKSLLAQERGVFLYHIFEYEWMDENIRAKIKANLKDKAFSQITKVYARKCEARFIGKEEKRDFLKQYHLQGNDASSVRVGLFYQDRLVQVMTFCKPRFNKKYDWEIGRLCSIESVQVIGGASKLLKFFLNYYTGKIITYSDFSKGEGKVYEALGFSFVGYSKPNYRWCYNAHTLSRYQCQMKNEKEIMTSRGYRQVYDCGNKIWEYVPQVNQ